MKGFIWQVTESLLNKHKKLIACIIDWLLSHFQCSCDESLDDKSKNKTKAEESEH